MASVPTGNVRRATAELVCHPATPGPAVRALTVAVERVGDCLLVLRYRLTGDPARLVLPASQPPERVDGLWQATCCEAFVRAGDGAGYVELNLAPSTAWALYRFTDRRVGMCSPPVARPPAIAVTPRSDGCELAATVDLTGVVAAAPWRLALAAVVAAVDGSRSYWALAHLGERPDFHHPAAFVLTLA